MVKQIGFNVHDCQHENALGDDESALFSMHHDEQISQPGETKVQWLILAYRVPNEPTRLRATVWRKLRSLGAIYLLNGTALFPLDPSAERTLRALRREIIDEMGGTAVLFLCDALAGAAEVKSQFNAARNDEYEEIIDRCQDFLVGLEQEVTSEHYTFAELEENEEDFTKLQRWFDKVCARDILAASGAQAVIDILAQCSKTLEHYADEVYQRDGN
jgi:hypothetical protein